MKDIRKQLLAASMWSTGSIFMRSVLPSTMQPADRPDGCLSPRAQPEGHPRAVDLPAVEGVARQIEALFSQVLDGERFLDDPSSPYAAISIPSRISLQVFCVHRRRLQHLRRHNRPLPPPRVNAPAPAKPKSAAPTESAGTYLRVSASQMEDLSGSMHHSSRSCGG